MPSNSFHVLYQPLSETLNSFVDSTISKLSYIFPSTNFSSETVLSSEECFRKCYHSRDMIVQDLESYVVAVSSWSFPDEFTCRHS